MAPTEDPPPASAPAIAAAPPPDLIAWAGRVPARFAVPGLLALFAAFAFNSASRDSVVYDETAHIAAGYSYYKFRDFRLNPEHPPLAKLWGALPLYLADPGNLPWDRVSWRSGLPWPVGFALINGAPYHPERRNPFTILRPARGAMILMGVLLGLLLYFWTRELWGPGAALISLALYAFSPTVLAHARLVTTDLAVALGMSATLWTFWRFTQRPGIARALVTGAALGFALLTKFSTLLLIPILLMLWAAWCLAAGIGERRGRWARGGTLLLLAFAVSYGCVWAGYGFRYATSPDPAFRWNPEWPVAKEGAVAAAMHFSDAHKLLPEAYSFGLVRLFGDIDTRNTWLNGKVRKGGTWYYFPETFLLKSTPGLLALLGWLLPLALWRSRRITYLRVFLAVPIIVYGVTCILAPINIGHRHLLPLYPIFFLLVGGACARLCPGNSRISLVAALLLLSHAGSSLIACPRYLPYFNFLIGGGQNARYYLGDSNLDWGQDLVRLRDRMAELGIEDVYLAYFGTGDPKAHGIQYYKTFMFPDLRPAEPQLAPPAGAILAVSVTLLQGLDGQDWEALRRLQPFDRAGDSILLFRLPAPTRP